MALDGTIDVVAVLVVIIDAGAVFIGTIDAFNAVVAATACNYGGPSVAAAAHAFATTNSLWKPQICI